MPFPDAAPPRRAAPPPPLASLEARAATLDLDRALSRRPLLRLAPGAPPALAFLHLRADAAALGAAPGSDLARHLGDVVGLRLAEALADPRQAAALLGGAPGALVDLPARAILPAVAPGTMVAALPMVSAVDPVAFAVCAAAARQQGWSIALQGLTADALAWLRPHRLPADWWVLPWSEALGGSVALQALRQLDPSRLILTGCDTAAALDWGLGLDIRIFGGTRLDGVLAGLGRAA